MRSSSLTCKLRAKRLSNLQRGILFFRVCQKYVPARVPRKKTQWPVDTRILLASGKSVQCSRSGHTYRGNSLANGYKLWLQTLYNSIKHNTEQRQPPRSVTEGLGTSSGEEYKCFLPPGVPKANSASPRVVLGSLISNTPTATPRRRTLTEDLAPAGAIGRRRQ